MRRFTAVAVVAVCLFSAFGAAWGAGVQELKAKGVPEVTAAQLLREYDENPIAAMDRYKEIGVILRGKIYTFTESGDGYAIALVEGEDAQSGVACVFPNELRPLVGNLKKGQELTVFGRPEKERKAQSATFVLFVVGALLQ